MKSSTKGAYTAAFSARLPIGPPVIGAWFPQENEMRDPDGYRDFLDAAAGGLRHFKAGPVEIRLDQPADVALWRDPKGAMRGVLQGYEGDVPADLAALTSNWLRLDVPTRLTED